MILVPKRILLGLLFVFVGPSLLAKDIDCNQLLENSQSIQFKASPVTDSLSQVSNHLVEEALVQVEMSDSESASTDALAAYRKSIYKLPVLRENKRKFLFKLRYLKALKEQSVERKESGLFENLINRKIRQLVEGNQRLVYSLARKYKGELDILDAISEGNIGLLKAIKKFDIDTFYFESGEKKYNEFSAYAYWWIRQEVIKARDRDKSIVIRPVRLARSMRKIGSAIRSLEIDLDRSPSLAEISKFIQSQDFKEANKYTISYIETCLGDYFTTETVVEEQQLGDDPEDKISLFDRASDLSENSPLDHALQLSESSVLKTLLGTLDDRSREVVELRFGLNGEELTQEEVGQIFGLSHERIRVLEMKALSVLSKRYQLMVENPQGFQLFLDQQKSKVNHAEKKQAEIDLKRPESVPVNMKETKLSFPRASDLIDSKIQELGRTNVVKLIQQLPVESENILNSPKMMADRYFRLGFEIELIADIAQIPVPQVKSLITDAVRSLKKQQNW